MSGKCADRQLPEGVKIQGDWRSYCEILLFDIFTMSLKKKPEI